MPAFGVGHGVAWSGRRANTGPAPSSINLTYAQVSGGLNGTLNFTGTAGKTSLISASTGDAPGLWSGKITGTYADILMFQNVNGQPAGMVEVSVDGGAFAAAPVVGGRYVLFSGLAQGPHLVIVRINQAYGGSANIPNSGVVMTVTGAPPSIVVGAASVIPGDNNANAIYTNAVVANVYGGTWTPTNMLSNAAPVAYNMPCVAVRGNPTELIITSRCRYTYVSVDGATPTRYDGGATNLERIINVTGLSGTKTYYVWAANTTSTRTHLSVQLVGGTISNIATKQRMDQFGDSITNGTSGTGGLTSAGEVEYMRVAAALGYLGGNFGVAGNTVANLVLRVPQIISSKIGASAIGANDVAILAIGRNDVIGTWDATRISNYQTMVNDLLTAGYRRVLCRGILPEGANTWPAENASIQGIVTGFADPRVKFVDTSSWSGIQTSDVVHPNDAGYTTMAAYALAAYPALIA